MIIIIKNNYIYKGKIVNSEALAEVGWGKTYMLQLKH